MVAGLPLEDIDDVLASDNSGAQLERYLRRKYKSFDINPEFEYITWEDEMQNSVAYEFAIANQGEDGTIKVVKELLLERSAGA